MTPIIPVTVYAVIKEELEHDKGEMVILFSIHLLAHCEASGNLVSRPGMEPVPPAVGVWCLINTGPPGKSLDSILF